MPPSSSQTTILITGGNNGIGLAASQYLSAQPSTHIIMASRSISKGESAIASIKSTIHPTSTISLVQLDITSDTSIAAAVKTVTHDILSNNTRLDILINNAGICPTETTRQTLATAFDTNAIGPCLVTRAFAPLLLRPSSSSTSSSSPARIIYVSSSLGSATRRLDPADQAYAAEYSAYRVSKAALNMVAACDAYEYRSENVKVFAFCPGYVVSDLAGERESKVSQGVAKSPETSAKGLWAIVQGKRDAEAGEFVHGEEVGGTYPW